MTNEIMMGCPECGLCGMNSPVARGENEFKCATNPLHKFTLGSDGFLKSL